ncbi:methyl-accepting chemotaxis protein [Alkalihalobacillus sp. MEB130]|uniref:methyl-accepting chemotaxis protein n=1 Tax=Alkalihalobacillus sp. MEB130 TaxID=2976704 RepID=UPI0028DDEE84|nr:methyl-accepting chemotaxis protein [Alkalihalobacillus sp. MEB130]MDT8859729.1 methyl-accepting chemotaxis protein [Alkalihalobacillus sp. MEB130]
MKAFKLKGLTGKILTLNFMILLVIAVLLGSISYYFSKQQLIDAGVTDLRHSINGTLAVLEQLNDQVENGQLQLSEAQEIAASYISGPYSNEAEKMRDFTKAAFLYKELGYMFVYDSNHFSLVHPMGLEGQDLSNLQDASGQYLIQDLVRISKNPDPELRTHVYDWTNADETVPREKLAYMGYYEPWDWMIGIGAYTEEFYENLGILQLVSIVVGVITLVIGSIIYYLFIRKYLQAIQNLNETAREIAAGNLATELTESKSNDEIGELTTSFNEMVTTIREIIQQVNDSSEQVAASSEQLSASSEETKLATNEVTMAMQSIASSNETQVKQMEEGSSSLAAMATNMSHVSGMVRNVSKLSVETAEEAERGNQVIREAVDQMGSITKSVSDSSEVVKKLDNRSTEIGQIIQVITGISDQTNLLALNAAIEAARAGEHGKGFAVVADEVRKLAEESKRSANLISELIKEIQADSSAAMEAMLKGTTDAENGLVVVNKAGLIFDTIHQSIKRVNEDIQNVSNSSVEITENTNRVKETIESLEEIVRQTAANSQNVASTSEEQLASMEEISASSDSLSQMAQGLSQIVQKFKL